MRRWIYVCAISALLGCGGSDGTNTDDEPETRATDPSHGEGDETGPEFDGLDGFWDADRAEALLARSETFELDADLSGLTEGERSAVARLIEIGMIVQHIYEESRHHQALALYEHLAHWTDEADSGHAELMRRLYAQFSGPIAFVEGQRIPFAPVDPYVPGRNVYPRDVDEATLSAYIEAHPEEPGLASPRTVVRRRAQEQQSMDSAALHTSPWLGALHPGLEARLRREADQTAFYAVPYSLAYAEDIVEMSEQLFSCAEDVRGDDPDLADYFEQRARDLLSDDYEAGDAAWVSGEFRRLNAEVGAYETYDDHLLGQKAFFATSILVRAPEESAELARAVRELGAFESALPGGPYGTVRARIPIGIYDVVADFGQARGANTASILPNEAHITRKYGRTILIRRNVITHPTIVAAAQRRFRAAVHADHAEDLGPRGNFDRTVWHEVGHYLGPKTTIDGRVVTEALGNLHNHIEELKADLVSLWLMPRLVELGVIDADRRRAAYAAGVLRTLVTSEPPRTSAYRTMQLMQQNYFLDQGVLRLEDDHLRVDYGRYARAVAAMLTEVLAIQRNGDRAAAEAFITRWAVWDPNIQGVLGPRLDEAAPRYWLPRYAALEEPETE